MFLDEASSVSSYYKLTRHGQVFMANTSITALGAYSTAAGIGGPLLWNNSGPGAGGATQRVMAVILAVGAGWTTAPAASGSVGVTCGSGQPSAPTSTAAITGVGPTNPGTTVTRACSVFNSGTVVNAGSSIIVTHAVSTAGSPVVPTLIALDGLMQVPPGCWAAVAGAAAIASMVGQFSLVWAEVPY